jgi:mRNA-degrading endonuclease RelE of RelBE toxin-antitoxin system
VVVSSGVSPTERITRLEEETARLREAKEEAGPPDGAPAEPDREEEALLGEEVTSLQPLRVPAFPQRFSKTLAALPRHVARSALKLIGQLAAGEPAAFAGMRRLRVRHEICRVRLAADYRLLFTPHADRLEVLDLIIRKDFEKWLKTLG